MGTQGAYILPFRNVLPRIAPGAFVAPGASVIGDVEMARDSSLWFSGVIRGDVNYVRIGARSNIQDGTVIHTATRDGPTLIGEDVVVGHQCLLHACILEDACMVGMGAVVMDYSVVESGAWVAAGALVPPNKRVKAGELWMGSPAKYVRPVSNAEREEIERVAAAYAARAKEYGEVPEIKSGL
ncbi:MAG: Carnitine operon protein CaiE [Alphaproteobacteria bacterium MarineAlpha10_Bin2]|nr:gamma carbonic anhydrase family protein [Pseudomonadota bacterium]PPR22051.1 MAG: Carnitine operon protein CaiE [Alphaproteobacteria bacterium MarineAlpha10_Bin2]